MKRAFGLTAAVALAAVALFIFLLAPAFAQTATPLDTATAGIATAIPATTAGIATAMPAATAGIATAMPAATAGIATAMPTTAATATTTPKALPNTGEPSDGTGTAVLLLAIAGFAILGGSYLVRRWAR